ncbi:hypothetical protein TU94_11080 [Streptomyces cyaneogriseus subsp. noncyanogenus]|uniref:Uncharacterized protein n=1 Tax=Streptomyces cyaneogriseus subsp. noncyanogenus TaxID=477245 RepID=A0A0C5GCM5_9ACTN|nr:hypothetical protein TU94_11080 [Streptomyces cyaneogriseus subsp. noncyanogenus]
MRTGDATGLQMTEPPMSPVNARTASGLLVMSVDGITRPQARAVWSCNGLYSARDMAAGWLTQWQSSAEMMPPSPARAWAAANRRSGPDMVAGRAKALGAR